MALGSEPFGADIPNQLFDDLVGAAEQRERKRDAEQLGGLQIEYNGALLLG
jgi:hypothetical protein